MSEMQDADASRTAVSSHPVPHDDVETNEGVVEVEEEKYILLRFPCFDYFANVHIGEYRVENGGPQEGPHDDEPPRKRKRREPTAAQQFSQLNATNATTEYNPDLCIQFLDPLLEADVPKIAIGDRVFQGRWLNECSNQVVLGLRPLTTDTTASSVGGGGGGQQLDRPPTQLERLPVGVTEDEVAVKHPKGLHHGPRKQGPKRGFRGVKVPTANMKAPRWGYSLAVRPDAVCIMELYETNGESTTA